jgi:hypothetical protein
MKYFWPCFMCILKIFFFFFLSLSPFRSSYMLLFCGTAGGGWDLVTPKKPKIKDQIKQTNNTSSSSSHAYTLILVPRRTTLCDRILEEEGVLGDLTITSYKLEFIPLEDDLLSLEMDNVWRELYLVSFFL